MALTLAFRLGYSADFQLGSHGALRIACSPSKRPGHPIGKSPRTPPKKILLKRSDLRFHYSSRQVYTVKRYRVRWELDLQASAFKLAVFIRRSFYGKRRFVTTSTLPGDFVWQWFSPSA
jgi:hypothetical protein